MRTFTPLFVLTALLLALLAPATAQARMYSYWERNGGYAQGWHPYEVRTASEYVRRHRRFRFAIDKEYFLSHPDRSQTHALHPYYRNTYFQPPINPDYLRFAGRYNSHSRYNVRDAYVPERAEISECRNYSYVRPNYRVPPYGYGC